MSHNAQCANFDVQCEQTTVFLFSLCHAAFNLTTAIASLCLQLYLFLSLKYNDSLYLHDIHIMTWYFKLQLCRYFTLTEVAWYSVSCRMFSPLLLVNDLQ